MQDLTKFVKERETDENNKNLLMANACISAELQAPQQTIIMLTK